MAIGAATTSTEKAKTDAISMRRTTRAFIVPITAVHLLGIDVRL